MFDLAHRIKFWSDCPQGRQHACIIAREGKYIIGTGYNGMPQHKDCCENAMDCLNYSTEKMRDRCVAVHAEVNALQNTTFPEVSTFLVAYVTKKPCIICKDALRQAGIAIIYWQEWHKGFIVDEGHDVLIKNV